MAQKQVRVIREMSQQFKACCSGVVVGSIGRLMKRNDSVPAEKEMVRFSAKSLGYSGGDPIIVYIESDALEIVQPNDED